MAGVSVVRSAAGVLPAEPGVYRFRDEAGRVIYVGRATDLRSRVRSYAGDLADRWHLRRMVPQVVRVEAIVCASVPEAAWLERNLLVRSLPRWNRIRGGMELVGWLVLDADPDRPGVHLVVGDARPDGDAFGPYLGVDRLGLARGALLRAWPLTLTGSRLDTAGSSLAEARGILPGHRTAHLEGLRGVLTRQPEAVAALAHLLETASAQAIGRLAFETAQQISSERAAVDWLVAPQRVTGCTPGLSVHGWSEGLGFALTAAGDRLDHWTSRPMTADAGRTESARTPPDWQEFATRNADLAAALRAASRRDERAPGNGPRGGLPRNEAARHEGPPGRGSGGVDDLQDGLA